MKIKRLMLIIPILVWFGCASGAKPPQYTLTEAVEELTSSTQEAISVEGGWEFQFPRKYYLQKATIEHTDVAGVTIYAKTEGRWKSIQTVDFRDSSPSEIALNVTTDAIRMAPKPVERGAITRCRFYAAKSRRTLAIPLEKPP